MRITVIIPAKNEENTIKGVIEKCYQYTDDVMVIDGHSQDKTREIAEELKAKVYTDNGLGKGDAIRIGILKAQRDILVFIDADGSHDPNDIPLLIEPILTDRADLVLVSRMRGCSDELHGTIGEFIRLIGSSLITLCINYKFKVRFTDSQNGFRAIKRNVALHLDLKEDITTIEQEMLIKALKKSYRISEVPGHEYRRKYGTSCIRVSKVWPRYLYSLFKNLFFT
jgi:dolichol-phosphate mannosyltransferase